MLPREPPGIQGLDVAFRMITATEVGGDYYDFRRGDDGTLTLTIGDATGHGLNAGLMVASTKSLFQGLDNGLGPKEALARIDRRLGGMKLRRMGMSLSPATWRGGVLRVASAGMPPALIFRSRGSRVEECLFSAPPLGTLRQRSFEERRLSLSVGNAALFATDGLVELLDPDDSALGYASVSEAFERAAGGSGEETVAALLDHARRWAGERPLADDLSLVVLRVV